MARHSSSFDADALGSLSGLFMLALVVTVVMVAVVLWVLVVAPIRIYGHTVAADRAAWFWWGAAALAAGLLLAALTALLSPTIALWIGSGTFGTFFAYLAVIDLAAGPDFGDPKQLLAPWRQIKARTA